MEGKTIDKSCYEEWLEHEGLSEIHGYYVDDIKAVPLSPWKRCGGLAAVINLEGTAQTNNAIICEIPPGERLNSEKHLYEEMILILSGSGASTVWNENGAKQTFEWQEGSLFSPPINTWHQHFNGQGDKPARYLAITNAPIVMNLFRNNDFIFSDTYLFRDRFTEEQDYFSRKMKLGQDNRSRGFKPWITNFMPDVRSFFNLDHEQRRGPGVKLARFQLSNNTMEAHIGEYGEATYKKAHRHGPGAHIIVLKGKGYSMIWHEGQPKMKFDWHPGTMFVPPGGWFHHHFNTGKEPARFIAVRWGGEGTQGLGWGNFQLDVSTRLGGDRIEFEDEDPEVRELFEAELAKEGLKSKMPSIAAKQA